MHKLYCSTEYLVASRQIYTSNMGAKVRVNQVIFSWEPTACLKQMAQIQIRLTNELWVPSKDHKCRKFILDETENNQYPGNALGKESFSLRVIFAR